MELIKWEPFGELDRLFENRLSQSPFLTKFGGDLAVDVYEKDGSVIAKINLPGVKKEELEVAIDEDLLKISGKREEEKEVDKKNYYSKEIRRGSFSRSVRLPNRVDAAKAVAKYSDGELVIEVPIVPGEREGVVKVPISG